MNGTPADVLRLHRVQKVLTRVLVLIAVVALVFTATNVTLFAIAHDVSPWIAWLLDPMVAIALGAVLVTDGVLGEYGIRPGGWATCLRWFTGLATWVMNCWDALWPAGTDFGVPRQVDSAALVLHSIPPVLLIVLAETITHYRRAILATIRTIEATADEPTGPRPADPAPERPTPTVEPTPPRTSRAPRTRGQRPPKRTAAQLLTAAREQTADWPDSELTADAIRKAVRTSQDNARTLRDALKRERQEAQVGAAA